MDRDEDDWEGEEEADVPAERGYWDEKM